MTTRGRPTWAEHAAHAFLVCLLLGSTSTCLRAASAPQTITLAVWASQPSELAALDRGIAAFTEATGIKVKREVIGDKFMDVLRSRFAARNTPDVFYLDSAEAPFLIKSGVLQSFDGRINDPHDFYPRFMDAFRGDDGKIYGLPKDYSTLALYINTKLLNAAGFKLSDVPTDHADFMHFARRLQARLKKGVGAFIFERDLARHMSAIEAYGQPVIDTSGNAHLSDNPGAIAYLSSYVRGRQEGYLFSPKDDLGADSASSAFGSGRAVMMMEGNWVLSALRKDFPETDFATRELPRVNGHAHTMAFVVGYAVSKFGKNPEGGFKFAQFMTQTGMKDWAQQSGTLPSRITVQNELRVSDDKVLAAHTLGAGYATVWSRGTSLPIVNSNFGNQFGAALNGSKSVVEALQRAQQASSREIERQR